MKLQNFAIIFALIAIPLILVLTYYIQLQVDTIALQNKYDTALLNALRDAVSSFEINTANEDLSSVSDSLRTIIEASNNVFFNTLSTNLGLSNASKTYVEPYIPAILYTLYDGYYISSPTQVPEVLTDPEERAVAVGDIGVIKPDEYEYVHTSEDEQNKCKVCSTAKLKGENLPHGMQNNVTELQYGDDGVGEDYGQLLYLKEKGNIYKYTTSIDDAQKTTKNVLKTYMPYSARYKSSNNFDITVIYTLDNYVTIEGTIIGKDSKKEEVYYTKSGYLIPDGVIDKDFFLLNYSQEDAENYIKNNPVSIEIDGINISSGQNGDTYDQLTERLTELNNTLEKAIIQNASPDEFDYEETRKNINNVQDELDKMSAVIYYVKAQIFSTWVYENVGYLADDNHKVKESDIVEISGIDYTTKNNSEQMIYDFKDSGIEVFNTTISGDTQEQKDYEGVAEIPINSPFYSHKLNVIRNSIQYNLNLAMSTYNEQTSNTYQYEMPIIQSEEWNKILNNVSVVAFMQGYPCKLKTYNNYKIVSSTNNEIAVSPKNIYYVPKEEFNDEEHEYHKINCDKLFLRELENNTKIGDEKTDLKKMSFSSKEIKYDRIISSDNSKYLYDHKNFACYDCINDGNYININIFINKDPDEERRENEILIKEIKEKYNKDITQEEIAATKKTLQYDYYIAVGKERNNLYKMNAIDNSQGYEVIYDNKKGLDSHTSTRPISDIKQIEVVLGTIKTSNIKENLRYDYVIDGSHVGDDFVKPNSISSNESSNTTLILNLNPSEFSNKKTTFFSKEILIVTNKNEAQSTTYLNTPGDNANDNNIFQEAIKYVRVIYK